MVEVFFIWASSLVVKEIKFVSKFSGLRIILTSDKVVLIFILEHTSVITKQQKSAAKNKLESEVVNCNIYMYMCNMLMVEHSSKI